LNSVRSVIFENALDVDDWYRKVKIPIDVCERDTWYIKIYDDVKKTNNIHMGSMRENYFMDGIGPRKFTHNECALFKGLDNWDYNRCKNKKRMYNKIAYASNVFVVRAISDKLIAYISDDNNQKAEKIEQKKEKCETQKKSKRKADKIIFPKCTLSEIKIIKLKGINNLVLKFDKNLVALMGVNGSGKSTILHALACTYSPYQKGESYQFSYFFTPNPDATWKDSCFTVINHDVNEGKDIFKTYEKRGNRWARYSTRPVRDVFYMGVSSCIPEIEIEKKISFINYVSSSEKDKLAEKIIEDAAYILNKDYEELMSHTTGKKKYIGVQTKKGIVYSALSMGAGEQRVIKLLQTVYNAHQYSLILIDEIDLLLHVDAFKKLIIRLSEIATDRNIQIIFTTHSLEINELNKYTDIRYIEHQDSKILVYDTIKPDLLYELSGERIHPYSIYVEDKFAAAIVREVAKDLNMQRHINIITFGSIENAFTVAAGKVLGKENINNILIVTDGDELVTIEDKTKRLNAILTGTESDHEEKVNKALSMITQFDLPVGMKPEKFVHSMLIRMDKDDECIVCARNITSVKESHDWIGKIEIQMGIGDLIYDHIMNIVSENECWWKYVNNIREWLKQKREEVRLISLDEQCVEQNL
jgi:AAA15 family ATPase/GTPase